MNPGIYLHEIQQELWQKSGVWLHTSTICKSLHRMGCTRQKIQHIALQRSDQSRAKFMAEISIYDPSMFVWIDETGCDQRNCRRKYSYSIRGITPQDHRILVRGTRYSAIGIMSLEGIMDVHIAEGTVNGERFTYFVTETLLPILNPFDGNNSLSIVIMDNASIHHVDDVVHAIEPTSHAKVIFLPPY